MNKEVKELLKKAEELDWMVTSDEDTVYDLSKYSPADYDFHIIVDTKDNAELFIKNIWNQYLQFDCSSEAYLWLDEEGHGTNGAPYNMKDVYEDMEACDKMILELYHELNKVLNDLRG